MERLGVRLKIYKQKLFFPFFRFYAGYHLYVGDQRFELFHSTQKKVLERLKMENQKKKKNQQKISHPLIDNFLEQVDPGFIKRIFFVSLKLLKYSMWMTFIKNKKTESISLNQRIRSWLNLWERTCR